MSGDPGLPPESQDVDETRSTDPRHLSVNAPILGGPGGGLRESDREVVEALIDEHYPFDCDVIALDGNRWAIHGPIPVDGEVILAEFDNEEDARAALRLMWTAEQRATPEETA